MTTFSITNLFKSNNNCDSNGISNVIINSQTDDSRIIENKVKNIVIRTLYFLGIMFMLIAVNASIKYPCMMNAVTAPIAISILCFKGAYTVYTKGVLEFPKVSLSAGAFQIGLV